MLIMANEAQKLTNRRKIELSTGLTPFCRAMISQNVFKLGCLFHKYVMNIRSRAGFVCYFAKQTQFPDGTNECKPLYHKGL